MGPLDGVTVIELEGLGPSPFAGMMLADMGAAVIKVDRFALPEGRVFADPSRDPLNRGRKSIALDLKAPAGRDLFLRLMSGCDALIEGLRPGAMERLGLGPAECHARNQRLVYGRVTGWGQEGPLAAVAGHDIDFLALSGALSLFGPAGMPPVPPVNFLGDFGAAGMLLAFGVLCGLFEARQSGRGQVVDAAAIDGLALFTGYVRSMKGIGFWSGERGRNAFDSGSHFYAAYETSDGEHIAIGALEPAFYSTLMDTLGLEHEPDEQLDPERWPELKARLTALFKTQTREHWTRLLQGTDSCFAPVLRLEEVPLHPQMQARRVFVETGGLQAASPAPRFSRTPAAAPAPTAGPGADTISILRGAGLDEEEIQGLLRADVVRQASVMKR